MLAMGVASCSWRGASHLRSSSPMHWPPGLTPRDGWRRFATTRIGLMPARPFSASAPRLAEELTQMLHQTRQQQRSSERRNAYGSPKYTLMLTRRFDRNEAGG